MHRYMLVELTDFRNGEDIRIIRNVGNVNETGANMQEKKDAQLS